MHLLPRVLGLLLLVSPCAADERLAPYVGDWAGKLTSSANKCVWKVRIKFRPQGDVLDGTFTYSGACAKSPASGNFSASPGEGDCLSGSVTLPGFPSLAGEACFDEDNNLSFSSPMGSCKLTLSEGGRRIDMTATSPQGTAEGAFGKLGHGKGKKQPRKGKKNEGKAKPARAEKEVLIGGY